MKKINHLQPPVAISKIRLDRFSPYFNEQKKYNIRINGPIKSYKYIYRDKGININKLAYYFDYNNDAVFENKILNEFVSQFENWKENFNQTDLFMYQRNMDKFVCRIGESNSIYKLNEIQGKILVYARNITSIKKIIENVITDVDCNEEDILSNIQELEKLGFIIMEKNKLLTIVLQFNPYIPSKNLIQNALNATSIS